MTKLFGKMRAFGLAVVALSLVLTGCGTKSSSQTSSPSGAVNVNPVALLASINNGVQQPVPQSLGGWDWSSFISSFGTLITSLRYTLQMQLGLSCQ
jgi:ABC-type glycerol-3-phosphate transport system substrate-binding protein